MGLNINEDNPNNPAIKDILIYPERTLITFGSINNVFQLGKVSYTKAHTPLEQHSHYGSMEICYLFRGKQTYFVEGKKYSLTGGDVFITFPYELHSSGTSPEDKSVLYYLIIDLESNKDSFIGYQADEGKELMDGLMGLKKRLFKGEPALKNILDDIIRASLNTGPYKKIKVRNRITEFIVKIIELEKTGNYDVSREIEETVRFINDNIYDDIDISMLSKRVNFSLPWFKQKFKKEIGMPPSEYIMRQKIEEAVKLLMDSQLHVTEIAHKLGFSSSQYFSSVFKKFLNASPKDYKRGYT